MKHMILPVLLAALMAGGCSKSGPAPLVVGMELAYPPFEMTDPGGQPAGVSVDLARALADYLGRPLKIENMPFDGLIPALKTGSIYLVLSNRFLRDFQTRGGFTELADRHLRDMKTAFDELGYPFVF